MSVGRLSQTQPSRHILLPMSTHLTLAGQYGGGKTMQYRLRLRERAIYRRSVAAVLEVQPARADALVHGHARGAAGGNGVCNGV